MLIQPRQKSSVVLAAYEFSQIADLVSAIPGTKHPFFVRRKEYNVNVDSPRLQCLVRSPACECCGLHGEVFYLEQPPRAGTPHFNLYGYRMVPVQLTKDHIVPKHRGGPTGLSNLQTLCVDCNGLKAGRQISIEALRKLREDALSTPAEVFCDG
jgi:hypothetical protein